MDIDEYETMLAEEATKGEPAAPDKEEVEADYVPSAFEDVPATEPEKTEPPAEPEKKDEPPVESEKKEEPPATEHNEDVKPEQKEPEHKTPENAEFARQRRLREQQEALEAEKQKWLNESPEGQLVKELSRTYNLPPNEILKRIQEGKAQEEAKRTGIPVEQIRARDAVALENQTLRDELQQTKSSVWSNRVLSESKALQTKYPNLTDEDLVAAADYMLKTLKNPELPIEHVARILHSGKMQEHDLKVMEQELLAKQSNRASTALPPQGTPKSTTPVTLTDAEKLVASRFGMSEAEYIKWK